MNISNRVSDRRAALFLTITAFLAYGGARIADLGFYRDNWVGLQIMGAASTPLEILKALADQPFLIRRPLDILLAAIPYSFFGAKPLGWQILGLVLNAAGAFAVYRVIKAFRVRDAISILAAATFLAYPSKDAALFWAGYINGPLALLTFFYGYLLHLDYIDAPRPWKPLAACAAFLVCFASYDSCLFLLPILLITPQAASGQSRTRLIRSTAYLLATTAAVMVLRFALIYRLGQASHIEITLRHGLLVYLASLNANFGPDLAVSTLSGIARAFRTSPFVAAAALLAPALALNRSETPRPDDRPEDRASLRRLIWLGAAVYVLGYLVVAISPYTPAPTAEENRLNLIPAAGIAFALGGWLSLSRRTRVAKGLAALAAALALVSSVGFSASWAEAYRRELAVRDLVMESLARWPRGDALFLRLPELHVDGRGSVFDHDLFFDSAVHLWTKDTERRSFVLRPGVEFTPVGLRLDGQETFPYDRLSILDAESGVLTVHPGYAECRRIPIPPIVHNPFATRLRALLGLKR